jgi:cytoskeletal protein CcmA (bactofilin family)
VESVHLVDRAINYSLAHSLSSQDTTRVSVFDESYKSLTVKTDFWGVFEKVFAQSQIKHKKISRVALVGQQQSQERTTLFLKDNKKPLVVVGQTKIEGVTYLPKRGVKTGQIAGQSYYGASYIYGSVKESHDFPELDKALKKHLWSYKESSVLNQNEVELIDLASDAKISNSFKNKLQLAYSHKSIKLSTIEVSGHIVIKSDTKIIVEETAKLSDVILIAPIIEVRKNVKGVFQAFATKRISTSENVRLDYPSALVLFGDSKVESEDRILEIKANTHIKGSVLFLGQPFANNYDAQIQIDNNAIIEGEVYCEQNLELRGTVLGSVYTNNFIVKEAGTTYQNHVFNAKIGVDYLAQEYVGVVSTNNTKGIVKWLY